LSTDGGDEWGEESENIYYNSYNHDLIKALKKDGKLADIKYAITKCTRSIEGQQTNADCNHYTTIALKGDITSKRVIRHITINTPLYPAKSYKMVRGGKKSVVPVLSYKGTQHILPIWIGKGQPYILQACYGDGADADKRCLSYNEVSAQSQSEGQEDAANNSMDYNVAISGDGKILAYARPFDSDADGGNKIYIYKYDTTDSEWKKATPLSRRGSTSGRFGYSLALNHDGSLLAVSDVYTYTAGANTYTPSEVYVYTKAPGNPDYSLVGDLKYTLPTTDDLQDNLSEESFGMSVAITGSVTRNADTSLEIDGKLVVSAPFASHKDSTGSLGKVYVFTLTGMDRNTPLDIITIDDAEGNGGFGMSLAAKRLQLENLGTRLFIAIGDPFNPSNNDVRSIVYNGEVNSTNPKSVSIINSYGVDLFGLNLSFSSKPDNKYTPILSIASAKSSRARLHTSNGTEEYTFPSSFSTLSTNKYNYSNIFKLATSLNPSDPTTTINSTNSTSISGNNILEDEDTGKYAQLQQVDLEYPDSGKSHAIIIATHTALYIASQADPTQYSLQSMTLYNGQKSCSDEQNSCYKIAYFNDGEN
jgi:hypothetical protein